MPRRMTYDDLFRISDPKRVDRSNTVSGPPLEIDPYRDSEYYSFNFKSHPSTTGLRHRGYVKFFRPRHGRPVPLEHLGCVVDCTCPDFRYRWAWANKQRNSSVVGHRSLNQALNRAPRRTNPTGKPGLCKHILAARRYIYGLLSKFDSDQPDTSYKLDKLLRYADKRWADFPGAVAAARARDRELRRRAQLRNVVGPLPAETPQVAGPEAVAVPEIDVPEPDAQEPVDQGPQGPQGPQETQAAGAQYQVPALPPEYELPPEGADETYTESPPSPVSNPKKGRIETGGYPTVAQRNATRYGESTHVVSTNGNTSMNDLKNAIKLVEDILDDAPETYESPDATAAVGDFAAPDLPPSEPPVSDSALGADTEGSTVVGLLTQIRDTLQTLAGPPEGAEELAGGGAEATTMPVDDVESGAEVGDEFTDLGVPEPEGGEMAPDAGGEIGDDEASDEDSSEAEDEDDAEERAVARKQAGKTTKGDEE